MKLSPLQLKRYSFVEFWVRQNPHADFGTINKNAEGPYPEFVGIEVTPELRSIKGERTEEVASYYLSLKVTGENGKESTFPYEFGAEIFGFFDLTLSSAITDPDRVATINGASILYGIIRDQLLTITHKSLHGPIMLPTTDFRSFNPTKDEVKAAETAVETNENQQQPKRRMRVKRKSS